MFVCWLTDRRGKKKMAARNKLRAVRRKPDRYGNCCVLIPGEYCRDGIHGDYHFCTPDGAHFCVLARHVAEGNLGISLEKTPACAGVNKREVRENDWTVIDDYWESR